MDVNGTRWDPLTEPRLEGNVRLGVFSRGNSRVTDREIVECQGRGSRGGGVTGKEGREESKGVEESG